VEVYPAYSVSGAVDDTFFQSVSKDINDKINFVVGTVTKTLPITVTPTLQLPAGTLSVAVGWQENSDWTAVYVLTINAQINPLVGIGVKFTVKALDLVGLMVGIPDCLTDYLGAINFSVEISGSVGVSGSVTIKAGVVSGSLGPTGQITITVGAEAKAGDDEVVSASISGSLSGGIKWSGTLDPPAAGGLLLHQSIQMTAVTGTIKCTLASFGISGSSSSTTTLWPGSQPTPLQDWVLIDPSSSS
jgi:hypothetical protein